MFKKTLASALILLMLIVLYICYYSFYILPKDVKRYEEYLKNVQNTHSHKDLEPTEEHRTGVQKDIWHFDGEKRLHYQICADTSTVTLTPSDHGFSLQEDLQNISSILQEQLYEDSLHRPMQRLNTFSAAHGIYDFTSHHFSAETVFLQFYTLFGHSIPKTLVEAPFLKGRAQSVSLTLSTHGPAFHADRFTAHMDFLEYER